MNEFDFGLGEDLERRDVPPDHPFRAVLLADEVAAELDDQAFAMELPSDSVRVKRFVTSHPGSPPSAVGQSVGNFAFTQADGTTIDRESLSGKVVDAATMAPIPGVTVATDLGQFGTTDVGAMTRFSFRFCLFFAQSSSAMAWSVLPRPMSSARIPPKLFVAR